MANGAMQRLFIEEARARLAHGKGQPGDEALLVLDQLTQEFHGMREEMRALANRPLLGTGGAIAGGSAATGGVAGLVWAIVHFLTAAPA